MKIKALITLHVNGKAVLPGEFVDIETEEAKSLIKRGFASNDKVSTETKSAPAKPPALATTVPTLEDIIDVIHDLDLKRGKRNVDALEVLLDADITAQQRDAAWEVFLKEQEADQNAGTGDHGADNYSDGDTGNDVQS